MDKFLLWIKNRVSWARDFIYDLLFPINCLGCGQSGKWLCAACRSQLNHNTRHQCPNCRTPNHFSEFCPHCQKHFDLNGIWVAGDYSDQLLATLIKTYKYNQTSNLGQILGSFMVE